MPIPPELTRFILTSVPSIPFLEAALLLRRDPGVAWTAETVAQALYIPAGRAELLLQELAHAGVSRAADADGRRWHYAPADEAIAGAYAAIEALYRVEMIAVTQLIHDATQRSATSFAKAFKLRRE